jgi:hypothetical protein
MILYAYLIVNIWCTVLSSTTSTSFILVRLRGRVPESKRDPSIDTECVSEGRVTCKT